MIFVPIRESEGESAMFVTVWELERVQCLSPSGNQRERVRCLSPSGNRRECNVCPHQGIRGRECNVCHRLGIGENAMFVPIRESEGESVMFVTVWESEGVQCQGIRRRVQCLSLSGDQKESAMFVLPIRGSGECNSFEVQKMPQNCSPFYFPCYVLMNYHSDYSASQLFCVIMIYIYV